MAAWPVVAQDMSDAEIQASLRFQKLRERQTLPLTGVAKVRALVAKIKPGDEGDRALSAKAYNALSVSERFAYVALFPESFSQICDAMMPVPHPEKKLFSHIPSPFTEEYSWSERQMNFLVNQRPAVVKMLRETMKARGHCGANLKGMVWQINGKELIPDLAALYRVNRTDRDLLTLMMLMMNDAKYMPFMGSKLCEDLYGGDKYWGIAIDWKPQYEAEILGLALRFAKSSD